MELATLNLDTYKIVKLLQTKGYSEEQAEGIVTTLQDITLSGVATKQDVNALKNELKEDLSDVRNELKEEIQDVRKEISNLLKFQVIQTLTIVGVMIALFQIF